MWWFLGGDRVMTRHLIITADDCGLSEGINHCAARLYEKGMISAVSIMTNFPATQHALTLLSQYPGLEAGVHLNLSDGFPLTDLPASSDLTRYQGDFRDRLLLFAQLVLPSDELLQMIHDELAAQIQVMVDAGIQPMHLTTHCHFHSMPAIRDVVYDLAETYGVRWVRNSDYRGASLPFNPLLTLDPADSSGHGFEIPDFLVSLKQWMRSPAPEMVAEIERLNGITEIIVHPDFEHDPAYPRQVRYTPAERHQEVQYLEQFWQHYQQRMAGDPQLYNFLQHPSSDI